MRIALVGLDSMYWPQAFARNLHALREAEYVACCDLGVAVEKARPSLGTTPEEYAREQDVPLYHDPDEMVTRERVEGVMICTRHSKLANYAEWAANRKLHCFIAKPMATTLEDADRVVRAVEKSGITATAGQSERRVGAIHEAYRRVKEGQIGRVLSIRSMHQHGILTRWPKEDWYREPEEGGPELWLGWYAVQVARWFAGAEASRVYAEVANYLTPESPFPDNIKALVRYHNEVMASLEVYFSVTFSFPSWEIEVMGSEGAIRTQQTNFEGVLLTKEGAQVFSRHQPDPLLEEIREWIACSREGRQTELTVQDARAILETCLAIRESGRTGRVIEISRK